jgi:ribosomal protein S27E
MAIRITCPGCQTALTLDDKMRGKKVRCKACAKVLSIPAAAKAKVLAEGPEEEAVQEEPKVKLGKASVPAEYDGDSAERSTKKKKKKKGKKGAGVLILAGVAALVVLLIVGGGLSAFIYFKPDKQEKKQEPLAKAAPEVKEKDDRTPARIVVPKIQDGNPATKKGGTGIISNVRGAAYRAERRSELKQIGLSYVQFADEYKGANRNQQTWLEYIKTFGPIRDSVKDGYYKMNFNARLEGSSVIAYESDIDNGQAHLCVRGDGSVDHVPLAELKTILGRDP